MQGACRWSVRPDDGKLLREKRPMRKVDVEIVRTGFFLREYNRRETERVVCFKSIGVVL